MTDFDRPSHDPTADTSVHPTADPATVTEAGGSPISTTGVGASAAEATAGGSATAVRRKSNRARWLAAGLIVALVVGITAIATLSLTGTSPNSKVLGYVPADSVAYGEVRMDLPGDQSRMLGAFLSHFPGFADQAALETKLNELLDRAVSEGSQGTQSYTGDIAPWFDGQIAFAMGALPASAFADDDPSAAASQSRALLLISVKDGAAATAWFKATLDEAAAAPGTTEDYNGTSLLRYTDPDMGDVDAAFAVIDGKIAVAGDLTSVKAAVDTKGSSGLVDDEGFAAALAASTGDHVGFMYIDLRAIVGAAMTMRSSDDSFAVTDKMLALVPDWMGFRLRVEADALVMDAAAPHVDGLPGPTTNHANGAAAFAPPTTLVMGAGNDVGATLKQWIDLLGEDPAMTDPMIQLEQALGLIGGLDAAIGWMGDTAYVVSSAGDTVEGGIISIPTDAADADRFLTTIRSLVAIGGGQAGITVREETHAGSTITIIDLGSAQDLLGMAGAMGGVPLDPGSVGRLPEGNIELSYAATADVVVIGSGPNFVKAVLDAGTGDSLADSARYRDLVARAGAEHTGVSFLDIAAIRTLAEGFLAQATAAERAEYETSVKPFLEPFDALVATTVLGDLDGQHVRITVK